MSHTPRVIIATRIYQPEAAAASFRLAALATALVSAGADVTVLTTRPPRGFALTDSGPVRVRRARVLRDSQGYVRGYLQYMSFDVPLFFRLLFSPRPDIVVAEPPPTTGLVVRWVCALRRVPYVYYAADIWSDASASLDAPGVVVRLLRVVESTVLRGAQSVIAVTGGLAARARDLGARRVEVVRNGVDTAVFSPDGSTSSEAPVRAYAVYAGTASEWQGAEVFVQAMRQVLTRVPEASLIFIGQGSAWDGIAETAHALPDGGRCVRMLGPVPPAEVSSWLRGARAALVSLRPGQGYDFAFPTKVLAGLASGAPVLYVGPGEAAETITRVGLGRAVPFKVDAVANALAEMLAQPVLEEERRRLSTWVEANLSASKMGSDAARCVLASVRRQP
ncbi:glycosyltransferase [Xylanimonas ulmi]|uniref:D-inositol 3-phosphate glycosyltransferase n=1 Tax=Xylanimonas ulmi TaxID=228973 RepID=A0A4Q7LXV5_9MICO|nr:glycosyltransferase [Xylanibacterium ulmi]RZS59925.1 glycosyltransferase involved in cell wall biosynthesis [Xylanibacterium ulmi]